MRRLAILPLVLLLTPAQAAVAPAAVASSTRTVVLTPAADSTARQQSATSPSGSAEGLLSDARETDGTASRATAYLRFTVPALAAGETVTAASLSLQVTNGTKDGPTVWRTDAAWSETTLAWGRQPARHGSAAGDFGRVPVGRVSTPVSGIGGAGEVSLQLHAESTDGLALASRESVAAARPRLVLTVTSVPDAAAGTTTAVDDATVTVDPGGAGFVLTGPDGSRQHFAMAEGDHYVSGLDVGISRAAFLSRLAGRHDHVRVVYRDPETGLSEFAVSGVGPYAAPSGTYQEAWDDHGVDVTIDPSGTSLVLAGTGYDPVRADDAFGSLLLRFPMSERSTYSWAVRDHAANTLTPQQAVSREEFVSRVGSSEFVNDVLFTYDAATGVGRFHVTGGTGPR
jgi:hypothetical protein